ncbi:helix-turn-helix DNA binding domain [Arthrobacter phage Bumble]|uniref:Resolvase HTH domain-containing protein n=1 Tax=Arthrobacter phage Bumble TaxID=2743904 RepID=A0A7G3V9R6_9CAUD|nr:hypothetical protein SEA_BUMBLE_36 [Arthrobacter phage Bumble]
MSTEAPRPVGRPRVLTNEQVERIRELVAGGQSQRSVADHFEISPTLVSMICRGLRYPDAPGPITYSYTPPQQTGQTL